MNFSNFPEPPSFEHVQNNFSQKNIDVLKEIQKTQLDQINHLNKLQLESEQESKINHRRFVIQTVISIASLIAAVVAAVAAIIAFGVITVII